MPDTPALALPGPGRLAAMALAGCILSPLLPSGMGIAIVLAAALMLPMHRHVRRLALLTGGLALLWLLSRIARLRVSARPIR